MRSQHVWQKIRRGVRNRQQRLRSGCELTPAQTRTRVAPGRRSNRKTLLIGGIAALSVLVLAGLYFGVLNRQAKPVSQAASDSGKIDRRLAV